MNWAECGSHELGGVWVRRAGRGVGHMSWAGCGSDELGGVWVTRAGRGVGQTSWAGCGSHELGVPEQRGAFPPPNVAQVLQQLEVRHPGNGRARRSLRQGHVR